MENNTTIKKIAKILYYFIRPFLWLRSKYISFSVGNRLNEAKKRAMREAEMTGRPRYIVMCNDKFYVYNRGAMLAMAKAYRKRTGLSTEWRKLYVCEVHVMSEAEKAEAKRRKEEENEKRS